MIDPYAILGLPRTFYIDHSIVEQTFRRLASSMHPDQTGGSTMAFQELQEAAAILSDPAKRLCYLAGASQTASIPLPPSAMALFSNVVTQLQCSDSLIKKYQAAQGVLLKATMINELIEARQEIHKVLSSVQEWYDSLQQKLRELDTPNSTPSSEALIELANSFNFAQRWNQQLREKELTLTTLLGSISYK